jgi:hypothetical protein
MNSGAEVWQGQKGDVFSDGTTDSDKAEGELAGLVDCSEHQVRATKPPDGDQPSREVGVGAKVAVGQPLRGQVEVLGGRSSVSQKDDCRKVVGGVEDLGKVVSCFIGEDGDVSVDKEREVNLVLSTPASQQISGGGVACTEDAGLSHWNPFDDPEVNVGLGLVEENALVDHFQGGQLPLLQLVEAREDSEGFLSDTGDESGGAHFVCSDLSVPTQECSNEGGGTVVRKGVKKSHKPSRPPLPLVGAPLSRQIAMKSMPQPRRRKNGDVGKHGSRKGQSGEAIQKQLPVFPPSVSTHLAGESTTEFELQVVLPFPGSGINHVVDSEGGWVSESGSGLEPGRVPEELEAAVLMGIQKEVGFNFEEGDEDVQRRLVELEKRDRQVNGERVQAMGYQ